MHPRAGLLLACLALAPASAQVDAGVRALTALRIEGGDRDDRRFAEAALGLKPGQPVDPLGFQQALAAVPDIRTDKVEAIKSQLDSDAYHPDGEAVADGIIKEHLAHGRHS